MLTQRNQKKPVATPKSVNWHWFFCFLLVFWHWFWPEFEIGNWFFLVFFLFFLAFFGFFFGIGLGQHSKLETGFLDSVGFFWFFFGIFWFFWYLNEGLEYHPKKTKKNNKEPVATPKLVNWLGFFCFFLGEQPPPPYYVIRELTSV